MAKKWFAETPTAEVPPVCPPEWEWLVQSIEEGQRNIQRKSLELNRLQMEITMHRGAVAACQQRLEALKMKRAADPVEDWAAVARAPNPNKNYNGQSLAKILPQIFMVYRTPLTLDQLAQDARMNGYDRGDTTQDNLKAAICALISGNSALYKKVGRGTYEYLGLGGGDANEEGKSPDVTAARRG